MLSEPEREQLIAKQILTLNKQHKNIKIKKIRGFGFEHGVVATGFIPKHTKLDKVTGEKLTFEQHNATYPQMSGYFPFYSFSADEYMLDMTDVRFASITRWCNTSGHNEKNNCIVEGITTPDYYLTTTANIAPGQQLLWSYPKTFGGKGCINTDNKEIENNFQQHNNKKLLDMSEEDIEQCNQRYQNGDLKGVMYHV